MFLEDKLGVALSFPKQNIAQGYLQTSLQAKCN